jgi:hypothetical protein
VKAQILVLLTALVSTSQALALECSRRAEAGRSESVLVEVEVEDSQSIKDCPFIVTEGAYVHTLMTVDKNYCYYFHPESSKATVCAKNKMKK